jgi:hypothetical protein
LTKASWAKHERLKRDKNSYWWQFWVSYYDVYYYLR